VGTVNIQPSDHAATAQGGARDSNEGSHALFFGRSTAGCHGLYSTNGISPAGYTSLTAAAALTAAWAVQGAMAAAVTSGGLFRASESSQGGECSSSATQAFVLYNRKAGHQY